MEKTKILYFITRLDQGGAQASVLSTLKTINKQQFDTYLATGPGGRLDHKFKGEEGHLFFIKALKHDVKAKYVFHDWVALVQMGLVLRKVRPD
ncbi:MAG: hypothetical protein IJ266_01820, partial [Elusimicrobiaceae bacterium]|nr:hypothetical protein [Elusimicrobiaceae bacterium]